MRFEPTVAAWCLIAAGGLAMPATGLAQLRVVNWNITAYTSGRVADFQNAFYGVVPNGLALAGQRMSPDVILAEEVAGTTATPTGANNFLALLNSAAGSPGDWARADYVETSVNNASNPSSCLFYRTSKVDLLTQTPFVAPSTQFTKVVTTGTGTCTTCPPRDTQRWRVRLKGYTGAGAEVYLYPAHFKAGSASSDQARRTPEADRIRTDSNALPAGSNFILGADTNMQSSSQQAYVNLLANGANANGRFIDPINSPGSWNGDSSFRYIHTQDPSGAGGMDDRHDQLLISPALRDGLGVDYVGSPSAVFSTSTWNDPNHSYRCWGNDGSSFNLALTTAGNTQVGASIAQSLINSALSGGHLPVYLDLRIPAKITTNVVTINFGSVNQNAVAQQTLTVANGINTVLWDRGGPTSYGGVERLQTLSYSMVASAGFTAPVGSFTRAAGAAANGHTISMNTSTTGHKTGTITISSNAMETPSLVINLVGDVITPPPSQCNPADICGSGATYDNGAVDVGPDNQLTIDDFLIFLAAFSDSTGCPGNSPCNPADICGSGATYDNGVVDIGPDGQLSIDDFLIFLSAFGDATGCP